MVKSILTATAAEAAEAQVLLKLVPPSALPDGRIDLDLLRSLALVYQAKGIDVRTLGTPSSGRRDVTTLPFAPVQTHPDKMSPDEHRALLADLPDSQALRTLLMAEVQAIRAGTVEREARTMRGLWYDVIKSPLSHAGILNKKTRHGHDVPWDKKLSDILAELVREGVTTYEELRVVDGSRQTQVAVTITHTVAAVSLVGAHYPWIILFTEKDTMWGEVQQIASLYGVSAISGAGEPSYASTENKIREIVRSKGYRAERPGRLIILSLTDYDPSGYNIAEAIVQQVFEVAQALPVRERGWLREVYHERLGLVPDQLTAELREAKSYEPKTKGLDEWFARTGGVDGKPLGIELDALPLSRLRAMFAEGIERHVDLENRRQDLREAYLDLLACEALLPDFAAKRTALIEAVKATPIWDEIEATTIPASLFREAALAGWDSINPVEDVELFGHDDEVREVMTEMLRAFGLVQDEGSGG